MGLCAIIGMTHDPVQYLDENSRDDFKTYSHVTTDFFDGLQALASSS
jgi:hypothetical protein